MKREDSRRKDREEKPLRERERVRASDSSRSKIEDHRPSRRDEKTINIIKAGREEEKKEGNGKKIEIVKVKDDIN